MVWSSRISRARFSLRPDLLLCPASEFGPIDRWLSRKFNIAGCRSTASSISANRLALERSRRAAADGALGDRYAKVIGPERDQTLDEADRRGIGLREPDPRVGAKGCLLGRSLRLQRRAGGH